ncbi:O-fucosyltransferase 27 isoform X1 [Phoenix dactylifera]|uniref:O-fucosyltransferase family protein n=1 Tax=Phoenix dactylifera TaxID=42345 RepID=A0A8B7C071_PHODC|nr:O-fucosyltransferase 27 isoform X1 [Phoenix dactylifera]
MGLKSRMKWAALGGLVLSVFSLVTHFLLAVYSGRSLSQYQEAGAVLSWVQRFQTGVLPALSPIHRRLWGPIRPLKSMLPHANPRGSYKAPTSEANGYIFVKIQGGFHEIRNSICDVVAVSRLLNATLVIPVLQPTTGNKGVSSDFKSFTYLYNEDQFIVALAKDISVVKALPKNIKAAKRRKEIPSFKVPYSASPDYYLEVVLPALKQYVVVELKVAEGGCLQAILPPQLEEYQRLRCRVAFHALLFRQEVQDLGMKMLRRLRVSGRPFLAYDAGMTLDTLAYHGCAELFQDIHTELIQRRRWWMIKHKLIRDKLSVDSMKRRLNGSCPLMPEEVGILLRAFGYSSDTIIYVSGGGLFGGQRIMIPFHGMFENAIDRTSISTVEELSSIYGHEESLLSDLPQQPLNKEEGLLEAWKTSGPRPRPLPPPPERPKYQSTGNDWWRWIANTNEKPEMTIMELRTNAHKLIWEAIDYFISVEADAFFPGFDQDGKGHPNLASMVMGHRLYLYAASKTFRPNREVVAKLFEETRSHLYEGNQTWRLLVREHLNRTALDGLNEASMNLKPLSFLSHPIPECSCLRQDRFEAASDGAAGSSKRLESRGLFGVTYSCPAWMETDISTVFEKEADTEEAGVFLSEQSFQWKNSQEIGGTEINGREDAQLEDEEDLEGGEG